MFGALHSSKHSNKTVEETIKNKTLNFLLVYVFAKVTCRAMKEDHTKGESGCKIRLHIFSERTTTRLTARSNASGWALNFVQVDRYIQ